MSHVYPRVVEMSSPQQFNEPACAAKVIELREADSEVTFERAVGHCLKVAGGTAADVERVWDEVEAERVKFRSISPAIYNTLTEYKTGLGMISKHLDPTDWYEGLKAELKVTTWSALHTWFAENQGTIEMTVP